ncbi:MAG: glycosyltransferase family 4 protein [Candidatus Krumholzibacteriota bacterium]|nr:glycosyltransferase family 4 protein [Candidatus Krumholzibacteriota bacterium]
MKKIFFINVLQYRPELPNFSDKYKLLSDSYHGDIVAFSPRRHNKCVFGNFKFFSIPIIQINILKHIVFVLGVLYYGLISHGKKKIDVIVAYDPLMCGISACLLRIFTRSKLVIEVNGDVMNAGFLGELTRLRKMKRNFISRLTAFLLKKADKVKFLNHQHAQIYSRLAGISDPEVFIDFVPTYLFSDGEPRFDKYLLFIGHPFFLKGVDILIKAFNMISADHSDFSLKIIGHCPDPDYYLALAGNNKMIKIQKPVFYEEIISEMKNCYCFVLPSRSEAMGRVIIESMASGKPVIGSNTGGIPSLVAEGETGFLFEKENISDLAEKMRYLLENETVAREMGAKAKKYVDENLSGPVYIKLFTRMIDSL